jgi:hypothetical protein
LAAPSSLTAFSSSLQGIVRKRPLLLLRSSVRASASGASSRALGLSSVARV